MEANALHDLTAAYALDALDPGDVREYEAHLARCERCRAELASLSEAAGALAYATEAPAPPAELRARILQQAQRERRNVVPLRPRWALPAAAAAAVVAACAAIALGAWAVSLHGKLDRQQRVAAVLGDPAAARNGLAGDRGTLVVSANGDAVLVLKRLAPAPPGKTYEAWVARGGSPQPAGTFAGGPQHSVVLLGQGVPQAAKVLVTVEHSGGSDAPTTQPFLSVQNSARS